MSINENLAIWLRNACAICMDVEDHECDDISEEDTVLIVGRSILSLPESSPVDVIVNEVAAIYSSDEESSMSEVVEYILVHAVSEHCSLRATFVEGIMGMEPDVQMYLMEIIQNKLVNQEEAEQVAEEDVEGEEEEVTIDLDMKPQERAITAEKVPQDSECTKCAERDTSVQQLQGEIASLNEQHRASTLHLKEEVSSASNRIVDLELVIVEKEDLLFKNEQAAEHLETQRGRTQTAEAKALQLEEQLVVLQDEVDVLRPQAVKLDLAESQLGRFRSKLDELSDIQQQLRVESASHSDTFDKLVLLEGEVEGLRKLKPQVDQYRAQFAETSIATQELQLRLQDKEVQAERLQGEISLLRGGQSDQQHQQQTMAEELRATAEQLRLRERVNGIGEGMSELNPALMQELNKLRTENKDLLGKLDQTSVAALEANRMELGDQKAVNGSLQKKWMATKESLDKAVTDIQVLSARVIDRDAACVSLTHRLQEASAMGQEEVCGWRLRSSQQLQFATRRHADAFALVHTGHASVNTIYSESLQQAHAALEDTQGQLQGMTGLQSETAQRLEESGGQLQEAGRKRKAMEMEHEEAVQQLDAKHTKDQHEATLSTQQLMLEEQQRSAAALGLEQQRALGLVADLEQETLKRRKIERQKKFHELEAQRQKAQLQVAGSSGGAMGDGVEAALAELRSMQQQLDDAHGELAVLRAGGGSVAVSAVAEGRAPGRTRSQSSYAGAADEVGSMRLSGYLEQAEVSDKRIEMLTREKRELLSKSLEEIKERNEVAQKLLITERENGALKDQLRKALLDRERSERKLTKELEAALGSGSSGTNKENLVI
ncbi:hypothetical protein B484DRAFT_449532 [Ochromonadaceae sp. CCMP2298]|nr:hypothetical protein B484DRAFT_449532 [Ochromonadaceae sp. CCMP2298]